MNNELRLDEMEVFEFKLFYFLTTLHLPFLSLYFAISYLLLHCFLYILQVTTHRLTFHDSEYLNRLPRLFMKIGTISNNNSPVDTTETRLLSYTNPPTSVVNMNTELRVKRRVPEAQLPTRTSAGAAGYDLYSSEECVIPAQGKVSSSYSLLNSIDGHDMSVSQKFSGSF